MHKTLLCLITWAVCSLSAQETDLCCPTECIPPPKPERIGVSQTEGKGLGYSRGYTSLDLFLSQPFCHSGLVPFLDVRGHRFNNDKYAANAGLGLRRINPCATQVWGINGFYDYTDTKHGHYNQAALGLEFFSERWEVHANGYLPVGHKRTPLYRFSYPDASATDFLLKGTEQFAMKGVDAEAGYRVCHEKCFDLYAGAGPYYYRGRSAATRNAFRHGHRQAAGGRLRACASYRDYVSLEGIATYDSLFKWGSQVTLSVTIPFDFTWNRGACCGSFCLQKRLYQPVLRNEILVIDRIDRYSTNPNVLDPNNEP